MLMIRLARFGAKKKPTYRVVVIDKERARDSRAVEVVGIYNPVAKPAAVKRSTSLTRKMSDLDSRKGLRPNQATSKRD